MKNEFTVLVDAAGTATAISVIKGLRHQKKYKCNIIAVDTNPFVAGHYLSDKFYTVPFANDPGAVGALIELCKGHADVVVPIFDSWLPSISSARNDFIKAGTFPLISAPDAISTCFDKYKTFMFFKENSIPTKETLTSDDAAEQIKKKKVNFPLIVKPRVGGRASLDVFKVSNEQEFSFHTANSKNWIAQEFIDGQEYTLDCLNTLDGKKCLAVVVRKRIETKGGLSVKAETVRDDELKNYAIKIGEKMNLVGPYNIQCFRDTAGKIYFTEVNPRFAGTHAFSIAAGMNSILHVLDMLNGVEVKPFFDKINCGLKMVRFWNEIIVENDAGEIPWGL